MAVKTWVSTPNAIPPLPTFSQAVISRGHVYASGNIGCTEDYKIVEGGVKVQTVRFYTHYQLSTGDQNIDVSVQRWIIFRLS